MEMSFADRLGFAALIMAFFSIAAPILWPDKKWIGWLSLVAAGALVVWWLFLEFRAKIPNLYQNYPIRSTLLVFIFGGVFAVSIWLLLIRAPAPSPHLAEEKPKPDLPVPVSPNKPAEVPPQKDNPHSPGVPHKPTVATTPTQHPQPELKLRFAYSKHPALIIENTSDVVARDIKWGVVLWNMDLPGHDDPLPIPIQTFDWIRAHGAGGPEGLFESPQVASLLKSGNRLFGSAFVDCPECSIGRTYIIYIVFGESGWFAEVENEKGGKLIYPKNFLRETREAYFALLERKVPKTLRIPIVGP